MSNGCLLITAACLLMRGASLPSSSPEPQASLRITQRALVATCMNEAPVQSSMRRWTVGAREVRLTVTMRNDPRYPDRDHGPAGAATIAFLPEPGHRYEVEVRADAKSFSRRVWTEGNWTPVVRDRTTDKIVSGPPEWAPTSCSPAR